MDHILALIAQPAEIPPDGLVPVRQQVVGILLALGFLGFLLYLAGRGRFSLRYFLLWFCMGVLGLTMSMVPDSMRFLSDLLGIRVPLNAVFFIAFFFVALQMVQLTVSVTRLEDQNKVLCQELAILRAESESGRNNRGLPGAQQDEETK